MKKLIIFLSILSISLLCYAAEVYIDGKSFEEFDVAGFRGISSFGVSATNSARLYYDTEDDKLKLSENGGAYANIGGGYTNLTSFVDQTAWRLFYSDGSGDVTELALGANGTYLKSNGATSAPTFDTPGGSGDVTSVGDCASGACFDGTSDGGTYLDFYDAQGRTRLIGGNTAAEANITLPNTTGTLIHTEVDPTVDSSAKIQAIIGAGVYESAGVAVADITDASANGRSLISALNYAAMRGLLDLEAGTDFYSISAADTAFEAELDNSAGLLGALSDETGTGLAVFNTSPQFETSINANYATASEILGTDASKNIVSLPVATYPSLTELSYVKGASSALQTQITAKGAHAGQVWTGTHDFGGATLEIPNGTADVALANAGEVNLNATDDQLSFHWGATGEIIGEASISGLRHLTAVFDPDAVCDGAVDRVFLMTVGDDAPEGITIVEWKVSFEADPTTEADLDLKYADAFIGVANAAVIDVLDTTAGVSSEDTNANINGGAAVANGKVIYLEFGTAYTETTHQVIFEMWFYNEED